jgi:hypothetical protein
VCPISSSAEGSQKVVYGNIRLSGQNPATASYPPLRAVDLLIQGTSALSGIPSNYSTLPAPSSLISLSHISHCSISLYPVWPSPAKVFLVLACLHCTIASAVETFPFPSRAARAAIRQRLVPTLESVAVYYWPNARATEKSMIATETPTPP